ncbi:hypothetical protein E2C01_045352 [Portunus trituberculatus]|uniref:Uncharacterized protein n=1 Tax=Portunus trituberculatus TaxID=210409 RepID=A0A5B7G206_PORTR|nr:hypothetical protein [Portunus trituberculatus]
MERCLAIRDPRQGIISDQATNTIPERQLPTTTCPAASHSAALRLGFILVTAFLYGSQRDSSATLSDAGRPTTTTTTLTHPLLRRQSSPATRKSKTAPHAAAKHTVQECSMHHHHHHHHHNLHALHHHHDQQ